MKLAAAERHDARQQEPVMKTFEMATSLIVGIAAQTLVIGLILVG
jgi:hypothetical protein